MVTRFGSGSIVSYHTVLQMSMVFLEPVHFIQKTRQINRPNGYSKADQAQPTKILFYAVLDQYFQQIHSNVTWRFRPINLCEQSLGEVISN